MMTRKTFVTLTIAIAAVGLAGSALVGMAMHGQGDDSRRITHAAWKTRFDAPSDMARGVDLVVLARAVSAVPGRVAVSDDGDDSLPFEEVTFEVVRGMKGVRSGSEIVVERAGGIDYEGVNVILDADGGPFEMEGVYLLFLKKQEDGPFYYQVNDQGRYRVEQDRLVAATDEDDPVAGFLHGKPVAEAIGLVSGYLRSPR